MEKVNHRKKKKILKFLEIDELNQLEQPLIQKARKAIQKPVNLMTETEKIAIRDFALLSLLYAGALRISEAVNLKRNNLNLEEGYVIIINSKGDDRIVDLPKPVIDIIKEWYEIRPSIMDNNYVFTRIKGSTRPEENNVPLRRQYYNQLIKKLAKATNVTLKGGESQELPHPHTLRHSRAMAIRDNGVELDVLQQILGHKDLKTTQVYAHARREEQRKAQLETMQGIVSL